MAFDDNKKLSRKERKEQEAQEAREQAEWDAKLAAKQEKARIKKLIDEIGKSEQELMENAALAKSKGYADVYRQQLSALKVARARKIQAEKFLFQIDSMEKMKSISDSTSSLLGSMNNIMGTLGKLSLDKEKMRETQMNFAQAQRTLGQQSQSIERFFGSMEMALPEEDEFIEEGGGILESSLEDEIAAMLKNKNSATNNANVDPEVAKFQQMFGM